MAIKDTDQLFLSLKLAGLSCGTCWICDVVSILNFLCTLDIFSTIGGRSKVAWVHVWFIPEVVGLMDYTVLLNPLAPTLHVTIVPVASVVLSMSIVEEFDGSTVTIKLIILELALLDVDVVLVPANFPADAVEHGGVLVNLSVGVNAIHFIGFNLEWNTILGLVDVEDSIFDHFCEVHDTMVAEQSMGFVAVLIIEV